ncbi:protein ECT2-like isoform X6 [Penaeus japonicus]|uniref:protein ECT2-like isoform X6 n=1 Tax=Penaeus japonicus TaxID=27405 RepID=UPI001C7162C4|nr:protein ECT2-like isoform X6 [Penaeus japonicus]
MDEDQDQKLKTFFILFIMGKWFRSKSDLTSVSQADAESSADPRICLVGCLVNDPVSLEAAKKFNVPVVTSETGEEYASDVNYCTYFIVADFESKEFEELHKLGARLLGKPALLELAKDGILIYNQRPVFCHVMIGVVLVFTGFRKKAEVSRLLKLVHYMGGSVKNEIRENVTHLLAYSSTGEKYQYATTFNIPVMGEDWVHTAWAHRDEVGARADTDSMMKYKIRVFHNLRMVLLGFPSEDQVQMEDLVRQNGGILTTLDDQHATHVVVEEQNVSEKPADCPPRAHVVKAEWFWTSIQMDACPNEKLHLFEEMNSSSVLSPRQMFVSPSTPGSRSRRRKRLRETVQQLAQDDSPSTLPSAPPARYSKRRSSVGDLAYLSADGSFLDETVPTPNRLIGRFPNEVDGADATPLSPPPVDLKQLSARQRVFHELVKTECNYVNILDTIEKVIKGPLESIVQPGGPMLDAQELKFIFGNLPPIHEVHKRMRNDLLQLAHNWSDDASIGDIILKYSSDLQAAYPPFINYFENMKEMLQRISIERPRFHAFLKIAQNKPECGRQSFQELLIRPVQRLPSMSLLINDILKHTEKTSPDHASLEQALDQIKSVMTYINDDKRKTEAKLKLFEIHNDIEMCPPNLVASHRLYLSKVDVTELSDTCSGRGDTLTLFLFNDVMEICKKKSKYNSIKSPSRANLHAIKPIKTYKHLEMMNLAHIKRIVDIRETEECHNVFALIIRANQEFKERLFTFALMPDDTTKAAFLKILCRTVANVVCRNDVENFLVSMDPHHLDIETSDVSLTNALSKALRFATRTGRKVSRAFSFNKSPSKLKRAVSTVMSPFGTLSQQSSMRGATSVNNLADLSLSGTPPSGGFAQPMATPTPRRRPLKHAQ